MKEYGNGFQLDGKRLKITAVGRIAVRWHRPNEGKVKTVRLVRQAGQWFACFACKLPAPKVELAHPTHLAPTHQQVGIDLNVENLLHDSDNRRVGSPKPYRQAQRDLRVVQRSLQRKQQGGHNRRKALLRVQHLHEHIRQQRQGLLNKQVYYYIHRYDLIGIEDLQIANMVRNKHLSKSILDEQARPSVQGWGYFTQRLVAKAANAGRQ